MSLCSARRYFLSGSNPHALEAYRGFVAAQKQTADESEAAFRSDVSLQIRQTQKQTTQVKI